MYHALITAGGVGERFWPLSRTDRPKQLLPLLDDRTMIRKTVDRLKPLFPVERIWIVTSRALGDALEVELPDLPPGQILREPCGRNTAVAIGLAALHITRRDPDASMVVQAADHAIEGEQAFLEMLEVAEEHARATGDFVTCGFVPTRIGTGFGHIERGESVATRRGQTLYRAVRFIEKPSHHDAERYTTSGRHLWNSGIFIWTLADLQSAFRRFMPDLHRALEHYGLSIGTPEETRALEGMYTSLTPIAIEYGILEPASNIAVIPGTFRWEDIGSWEGLRNVLPIDPAGNVVKGDVLVHDSGSSTIYCENGLVAVVGLDNMVVVKSGDIVLVCPRDRAADVKKLIEQYRDMPVMRNRT